MSATTPRGGSGVSARPITPSLQLAKLSGLLAKSLENQMSHQVCSRF